MKNLFLRGAGVVIALAMPFAGLIWLGGPAGADTTGTFNITPSFKFTSPTLKQTVECQTIDSVKFTHLFSTGTQQSQCTITGTGSFKTLPHTATTASILFPAGSLDTETGNRILYMDTANFNLTYGTHGHCTITYATIELSRTGASKYLKSNVPTKGNVTVSGTGSVCTTIKTLLATNTSKFSVKVSFTPGP